MLVRLLCDRCVPCGRNNNNRTTSLPEALCALQEDNPCPVHGVPAETTPAVDPNATTDPNADQTPPQTVAAGGE
ncbi:MAG: hypothetical protein LKM40_07105 [Mageeibacillus sp.]|nr:hypothetical protein [Mageeibacillus sp.]